MNKVIITIGVLATMSFTSSTISNIAYNHALNSAIKDIDDYTEWMKADVENHVVHPTVGQLYIENFAATREKLQIVHEQLDHFLDD